MHFGGLEGAKGRPMGAKRPPKSRKIASKFDVDFGMHFGRPKTKKMEAKGRPREPTWSQKAAKMEPKRSQNQAKAPEAEYAKNVLGMVF